MRTPAQLKSALAKQPNLAKFAEENGLALRTLWRIIAGQSVRKGTALLVGMALDNPKGKK